MPDLMTNHFPLPPPQTAELQERLTALQTEKDELGNRHDDLLYEWEKTRNYNEKLETHLAEASEKVTRRGTGGHGRQTGSLEG